MSQTPAQHTQDHKPNEVISEDDDDFAVVGLDLELADLSRFSSMGFPIVPPAGSLSTTTRSASRSQGKRGPDSSKRGVGFRRKDRLFFAGPPPPVPASETTEFDPANFLVVANLHWIISDADVWDGGCTYGPVRGLYIFEEPYRKKSEGVSLVEFVSHNGPINARKDSGRAWSAKQSDRPVHLFNISDAVVTALQEQVNASTMEEAPHWTRTASISPQLITAVLACAGKTPSSIQPQIGSGAPPETIPHQLTEKHAETSDTIVLPLAIRALIESLGEKRDKSESHIAATRGQ